MPGWRLKEYQETYHDHGIADEADDRPIAEFRWNHGPGKMISDDAVVPDAVGNHVIERLPTGLVCVNKHEAIGDDHTL